jgi:putative transcriptional regulator
MLHSSEWSIDATQEINTHWSMTSHRSMFHHLADRDCPNNFIMTFGFSGWARGQLEQELQGLPPYSVDSSWLTWRQPDQQMLEVAPDELWRISCEQSSHQAVNSWMT